MEINSLKQLPQLPFFEGNFGGSIFSDIELRAEETMKVPIDNIVITDDLPDTKWKVTSIGGVIVPCDGVVAVQMEVMFSIRKNYDGIILYKNDTYMFDDYFPAGQQGYGACPCGVHILEVNKGDILQMMVRSGVTGDRVAKNTRTHMTIWYVKANL